jgi:hypothetical protein
MKSDYTDQATTDLEELQTRVDQNDIFQFLASLDSNFSTTRGDLAL